jgi:hypothetical protein
MNLFIKRRWFTNISTIGELYIDTHWQCYTLEDKMREKFDQEKHLWIWRHEFKIPAMTAIPSGHYQVIVDFSNRYQRPMPHILNVPDFEGIRIHPGNTAQDTEGCILLGRGKQPDFVTHSRDAFNEFYEKLNHGLEQGKVFLTIENVLEPETNQIIVGAANETI